MRLVAVGLAALAVACGGKKESTGAGSGTGSGSAVAKIVGWEAGCAKAFDDARVAPASERYAILASGCPACGIDWAPIHESMALDDDGNSIADKLAVDAAVKACGGACTASARDQFLADFDKIQGRTTRHRPWRQLSRDCEDHLWPGMGGRFASAPWYVLTQIARAVVGHPPAKSTVTVTGAAISIPLPGASLGGFGFPLPAAKNVLPDPPRVHLTIVAARPIVAPAPWVDIGPAGLSLPEIDYPGVAIKPAKVPAALDKLVPKDSPLQVAIVTMHNAPAFWIRDAVTWTAGRDIRLAAFGPSPAAGWDDVPRSMTPILRVVSPAKLAPTAVVIGLGGGGRYGAIEAGKVIDACGEAGDVLAVDKLVGRAMASSKDPQIAIATGAEVTTTVDDLAAVIDALGALGHGEVTLSEPAWPKELPPCP